MLRKNAGKIRHLPIYLALIVIIIIASVVVGFLIIQQNSSNKESGKNEAGQEYTEQVGQNTGDSLMNAGEQSDVCASISEYITISTEYGDLYYPEQWCDYLVTNETRESDSLLISFSAKICEAEYPLFLVTIGSSDDAVVGELTDNSGVKREVHIKVIELEENTALSKEEQQRVYAMQEDLNYVIDHLA